MSRMRALHDSMSLLEDGIGSAHPSGGSRNVNGCPSLIRLCTIRRVLVRRMCWSAMMSSSQRLFWLRNPAKFRSHWLYDAIHSAAVLTSETRDDVVARPGQQRRPGRARLTPRHVPSDYVAAGDRDEHDRVVVQVDAVEVHHVVCGLATMC